MSLGFSLVIIANYQIYSLLLEDFTLKQSMLAKKKKNVKTNCLITFQPSFALLSEWSPLSHCLYIRVCYTMTKANKFLWLFFSVNTLVELPIKNKQERNCWNVTFSQTNISHLCIQNFSHYWDLQYLFEGTRRCPSISSLSSFHFVIQLEYVFTGNSSRQALFHLLSTVPT